MSAHEHRNPHVGEEVKAVSRSLTAEQRLREWADNPNDRTLALQSSELRTLVAALLARTDELTRAHDRVDGACEALSDEDAAFIRAALVGSSPAAEAETCPTCKGAGWVESSFGGGIRATCRTCRGTGVGAGGVSDSREEAVNTTVAPPVTLDFDAGNVPTGEAPNA